MIKKVKFVKLVHPEGTLESTGSNHESCGETDV